MNDILLEMKNISKSFPGVRALDDVSLKVRRGTVHALMGENGAGKSTLMKCLFGIYHADSGEIFLEGKKVQFRNSKDALENGVAMVHQELNQALKRNITDNLWLGRYPTTLGFVISEKKMYEETMKIFDNLGIDEDPHTLMSRLSVSKRQMVEIAKAVSYNSKIIVFDEPTSSLTETEAEHLFRIIDLLKKRGAGIIYISHKMEEILKISDDVTVMRDGKYVATEEASELTTDKIIKLMVGRELTNRFPPKSNTPGKEIINVKNLSGAYSNVKDVSFSLREGEILGIAGLAGAGRSELLETIFGIAKKKSGTVTVHGRRADNRSSRQAIQNGFALLTEERRATGIFGILDIIANTTISNLKNYRSGGIFLSSSKMKSDTMWAVRSMKIKTPSLKTKIRTLSGGNQQKVILGRWLLTKPEILLLDEPTRGIDVGAKYEIYQLIIDLAASGKSVIMVSSEMPELLGVCDRRLVMSGGRAAGELPGQTTQEEIMELSAKYV